MNELKTLLTKAYNLERDMKDFIHQCFTRIYGEDGKRAYQEFLNDIERGYDYNGCLQSLISYDADMELWQENRKRYHEGFSYQPEDKK